MSSPGGPNLDAVTRKIDCIHTVPDPIAFYDTYVRQRQPVHITSAASSDAVVPILLENPNILQLGPFLRILQRIIRTYQQKCISVNDDRDNNEDYDDDFMEQYNKVEVNVRSITTSTNYNTDDTNTRIIQQNAVTTMIPTTMPFHEMYHKLFVERNERYYMTTPTLPLINHELDQPDIMTFITKQILLHCHDDDNHNHNNNNDHVDANHNNNQLPPRPRPYLPLRPQLLGNLIPMNVGNIWIGCTSQPQPNDPPSSSSSSSSSGLHHDYHDNLYCLIHGTKIVRLAPPESIRHMEMVGTIHTLHRNGRIVYQEQIDEVCSNNISNNSTTGCPIRPDGALASVETMLQLELRKEEIESELALLSSDSNDQSKEIESKIELLEEELNGIEEHILDMEMSGNDKIKKQRAGHLEDENNEDNTDSNCDDDDEESEEEGIFFGNAGNKSSMNIHQLASTLSYDKSDDREQQQHLPKPKRAKYDHSDDQDTKLSNEVSSNGYNNHLLPPNFVKQYDPTKVSFQTITMRPGDALYLPAGWFHEVTSIGAGNSTNEGSSTHIGNNLGTNSYQHPNTTSNDPIGIHMAINYWYHPPDVGDPTDHNIIPNFDQPYISQFWQHDWDQRQLD